MSHHYVLNSIFMLHAVQNILHTLSHFILTIALTSQVYSYSPLKLEKKKKKTKIDITCPKSHNYKEAKSGFELKFI